MATLLRFWRSLSTWQVVVLAILAFLAIEGLARIFVWVVERIQKHGQRD